MISVYSEQSEINNKALKLIEEKESQSIDSLNPSLNELRMQIERDMNILSTIEW